MTMETPSFTSTTNKNQEFGPLSPARATEAVARRIAVHPGMASLRLFGERLRAKPLDRAELAMMFASTAEFFREIPGGILALALRLTDDWMPFRRFGAVSEGAQILYSAVDEFGLHQLRRGVQQSHHQYFLSMIEGFGYGENDLLEPANVTDAASEMAALTNLFYRHRSIGESLGFHLASELTSDIEFSLCLEGLQAFPREYSLTGPEDDRLGFYLIHTQVEPMHGASGQTAVERYLSRRPGTADEVRAGADAFMTGYGRFFIALLDRLSAGSDRPCSYPNVAQGIGRLN